MRRVPIVLTLLATVLPSAPVRAQDAATRAVSVTRVVSVAHIQGRRERDQRRGEARETQTERLTRTVNIGADGELDIANISGDITVTRGGGNSAAIEIVKTAHARTADEAREILALVSVDISERGGRAEIRARYPRQDEGRRGNRRNMNVDVAVTISAPQNTRIIARSISGSLKVRDIMGTLDLESVSGNVMLANTGRATNAKTISGNVEMVDARADGALSAGTISGTVKLQRVTARQLSLSSVSGNVSLVDIVCDRTKAQSISGDIEFAGDFEPNGRYEFTSHSGNVRLAVGGKSGFQVEASSFSGTINSDLPITLEGGQGASRRAKTLRGKYGAGTAFLDLTTFSGTIQITKR